MAPWCKTILAAAAVFSAAVAQAETDAVARGRALFVTGLRADGKPVVAHSGDSGVSLPAAFVACEKCHGYDARGQTEAGVTVSDIRWESLAKPYALPRADGRKRAPYDDTAFFRAVTVGRDSGGQPLASTMPRFDLTAAECADLRAYLQSIDARADEGVSATVIRLGLAMPARPGTEAATEERLLRAWAEGVNERGGIFRRRIEWVRVDANSVGPMPAVVAMYLTEGVSPKGGAECERTRIPHLQRTAGGGDETRYAFAFLPDAVERTLLLARHATEDASGTDVRVAVLSAPDFPVDALRERLASAGWGANVAVVPYTGDPRQVRRDLAAAGIRHAVLAGRLPQFQTLLAAVGLQDEGVLFYSPDLSTPPSTLAHGSASPLFTLRCAEESDVAPETLAAYRVSTAGRAVIDDDGCAVLAAARLLEFALENAGRELGREKLRDALEALSEVRTGFAPPAGFAPRRHVAAAGVYLVPPAGGATNARATWLPFVSGS